MTSLFEAVEGLSRAWGDWMLSMTWQVALLVVLLALLTRVCRQKSAVLLHTLWLLALVRLVVPPAFAFPTGWSYWAFAAERAPAATATAARSLVSRPQVETGTSSEQPAKDIRVTGELTRSGAEPVESAEPAASGPAESAATAAVAPPAAARSWGSYLMLAWGGVAGTLLAVLGFGSLRIRRWVRDAEPIDDADLYALLADCRERLSMGRLVELRNSQECTTPVVVGFRRPVILLPRSVLEKLGRDEMRAVLLHELFHIARGDAIVNLVQGILGALYFFHPLVWWANATLRRLREEACDELTVAALDGQRRTYGEALVKVTEIFGYASPPLALGVMESKSPARERLERILDPQLPHAARWSWGTLAIVMLAAAVLLPGAGGRSQGAPAGPAEQSEDASGEKSAEAETPAAPQNIPARSPSDEERRNAADATAIRKTAVEKTAAVVDKTAAASDGKPPLLRYRWEAGRTYAYSIQIEADRGDRIELLLGTPVYHVRSAGQDGTELVFTGRLMPSQRMKPRQRIGPFGPPRHLRGPFSPFSGVGIQPFPTEEHTLRLDDRGNVQSLRGQSQLPFVLGNLSQLVIVPFPDAAVERWDSSEKSTISLLADDGRFPRPRFGPFAAREAGERLEARERVVYALEQGAAGATVIRRDYELKTTELHDGQPRFEMSGTSRITFDRGVGLPTEFKGEFKLVQTTDNITQRIPITVSAKLLSEAERRDLEAAQQEAARRKPLDDKSLTIAIGDLGAKDAFKVQNAAGKLERAEPVDRQEEVARALEARLTDKENFVRQSVARALVVWATADSVPALIEALDDDFFTVPWAALEALGRLKDSRAIDPIVAMIKGKQHRLQAVQALAALGNQAEPAVLPLLAEADSDLRHDACQVLKSVGGEKSLEPLRDVNRNDDNGIVRLVAQQAIDAIEKRQQ